MAYYSQLPRVIKVREFGYEPDPDGSSTNVELRVWDPIVYVFKEVDHYKWSFKSEDWKHIKNEKDAYEVELIECSECDNKSHDIDTCKYCTDVFEQVYLPDLAYTNRPLHRIFKHYLANCLLSSNALELYNAKIENEEKEEVLRRMKKYDD